MPIEAKDIIEYLGAKPEEIDSIDKLKSHFEGKFTPKNKVDSDTIANILTPVFKNLDKKFRTKLSEVGIEISKEETEGKNFDDIMELGVSRFKEEKEKFEAFKKTAGNPTEEYKALEGKFKTLETQYNDVNTKYSGLNTEYENFKATKDQELKSFKLRTKLNEIHSEKVKFADGVKELEKEGFYSTVNKMYEPDYDEKTDKVYVIDRSTGKRIPGKKAGEDKLYEEILPELGIEKKVWKLNNHLPNQQQSQNQQRTQEPAQDFTPVNGRKLATRIS